MSKPIDKQYLVDNMKTFVSVILDPRYIIQKKVLPQATADLEGVVYQYIGSDTTNYTIGGFYQCQEVTPSTTPKTYAFVEITTKTAIDGVTIQENINKEIYAVDATSLLKGVIKLGNGLSTDTNGATNVVDRVIVASTMPTAAAALDGNVYLYCGTTTTTAPIYQKGYLYKCQESSTTGVYEFVQIGLHADEETIHTAADGELSVDGKYKKIFNGSSTDWGLLSTQQKTEYDFTAFSDEDEADVDTAVDAVTDGDMHAVTSNAVANYVKHVTKNGRTGFTGTTPSKWEIIEFDDNFALCIGENTSEVTFSSGNAVSMTLPDGYTFINVISANAFAVSNTAWVTATSHQYSAGSFINIGVTTYLQAGTYNPGNIREILIATKN